MLWQSALAIYFLFWFLSLFFILPFHGRGTEDEAGEADGQSIDAPGHDRGAPAHFRFIRAALQVTLLSALLFAAYYAIYSSGLVTRETLSFFIHPPR